jgi:hypothetical protein
MMRLSAQARVPPHTKNNIVVCINGDCCVVTLIIGGGCGKYGASPAVARLQRRPLRGMHAGTIRRTRPRARPASRLSRALGSTARACNTVYSAAPQGASSARSCWTAGGWRSRLPPHPGERAAGGA